MHVHSDDRGFSAMSVLDHLPELPGQVNASVMYAGAVKAWHRHQRQDDHWCVLSGDLKVGLFNSGTAALAAELRLAGSTPGSDQVTVVDVPAGGGRSVFLGEHRPGVLRIPAGLWHGAVAVGGRNAVLLYYVTRRYDPYQPDEERAAWNHFPFEWGVEFR